MILIVHYLFFFVKRTCADYSNGLYGAFEVVGSFGLVADRHDKVIDEGANCS